MKAETLAPMLPLQLFTIGGIQVQRTTKGLVCTLLSNGPIYSRTARAEKTMIDLRPQILIKWLNLPFSAEYQEE